MELTQQQQTMAVALLAIFIVLMVVYHFSQKLKVTEFDQKNLEDQNNELTTQIALKHQALDQFESQTLESRK